MGLFSRDRETDENSQSPFEGRAFVLSAIVVGAALVCGVALFFLGRDPETPRATPTQQPSAPVTTAPSEEPTGPPATPDPTQPTQRPTKPDGVLACKLAANEEGLTEAPRAVSWDFEDGVLVPTKAEVGAGIVDDDGLRRCYRRSPAGAVFAAMTTLAQAQNPDKTMAVVQRRLAPGPGQQMALAEARRLKASPTPDNVRNQLGQMQYAGYKIVDYTPNRAVLSVAIQVEDENIGGVAVVMSWQGGDWKVVLRPDGELGPDPDLLATLDGYIAFKGA
jgi:hypothetical protein